ncbi:MAG: shikimate kinase [Halieaceae bacterium]
MNSAENIPHTISLIGMPGAGKSTVGVILAKLLGRQFRDTDLDIQLRERATLQEILDHRGYQALRKIEEEVLLAIALDDAVISTGGSAVYSEASMQRLQQAGPVVYLNTDLQTLAPRVAATPNRGMASSKEQSFAEVYAERTPLYAQQATHTVDATAGTADDIAMMIARLLCS